MISYFWVVAALETAYAAKFYCPNEACKDTRLSRKFLDGPPKSRMFLPLAAKIPPKADRIHSDWTRLKQFYAPASLAATPKAVSSCRRHFVRLPWTATAEAMGTTETTRGAAPR